MQSYVCGTGETGRLGKKAEEGCQDFCRGRTAGGQAPEAGRLAGRRAAIRDTGAARCTAAAYYAAAAAAAFGLLAE